MSQAGLAAPCNSSVTEADAPAKKTDCKRRDQQDLNCSPAEVRSFIEIEDYEEGTSDRAQDCKHHEVRA